MPVAVKNIVQSYGFAIWLSAFVFIRVPLAVIQEYLGLVSRPFILINIISLGIVLVSIFDQGLKPLLILKYRPFFLAVSSLFIFWLIYFFRLGLDSFVEPIIFIESPFDLSKSFIISTLIPVLCLPWILNIRSCINSLVICSAFGNISIFTGIMAFLNKSIVAGNNIGMSRFSFEDLNPIPAGHSSASLVIFGVVLLCCDNKKISPFSSKFISLTSSLSILLGLWGVRLSQTKSAYIALLPVMIYCFYWIWSHTRYRWLFAGLVSLSLAWAFPSERVSTIGLHLQDASVGERMKMFAAVWQWIGAHPFLGVGFNLQSLLYSLPNTIGSHWYPHNLFLDVLGIGGLIMLAPLLTFILLIVRSIWSELSFGRALDPLSLGFVFLWTQSVFLSCFSGHVSLLPGFWVGGLIVVFVCSRESNIDKIWLS